MTTEPTPSPADVDETAEPPVGKLGSMLPQFIREHQMNEAAKALFDSAVNDAIILGADVHTSPPIQQ
jgi:hypothetical protein